MMVSTATARPAVGEPEADASVIVARQRAQAVQDEIAVATSGLQQLRAEREALRAGQVTASPGQTLKEAVQARLAGDERLGQQIERATLGLRMLDRTLDDANRAVRKAVAAAHGRAQAAATAHALDVIDRMLPLVEQLAPLHLELEQARARTARPRALPVPLVLAGGQSFAEWMRQARQTLASQAQHPERDALQRDTDRRLAGVTR